MILDGRKIASEIYDDLTNKIKKLPKIPKLVVILVGENSSSLAYIQQKEKYAKLVGIFFELRQFSITVTEKQLIQEIESINHDSEVTGMIVQLPLPKHIDVRKIIDAIDPKKDLDGFTEQAAGKVFFWNGGLEPCTPKGVMRLLEAYGIVISGRNAVMVGQSNIVGKPLALMLMNKGATVTSCNSLTQDLSTHTKMADILVVATGKVGLITKEMVKNGAVIIDVGFTFQDGKIYGDAAFEELEKDHLITPVPGGVGPMTVAMLMENTYLAALMS